MKIIALHGPRSSGKTTAANFILEDSPSAVLMSFADPMRQMLQCVLEPVDKLYPLKPQEQSWEEVWRDEKFKMKKVPVVGRTVRYLLQTLGTEWGRDIVDDMLWTNLLWMRVTQAAENEVPLVVVDDLRFRSELAMLAGLAHKHRYIELQLVELEVPQPKKTWAETWLPGKVHKSDKPLHIEKYLKWVKPSRVDYEKIVNGKDDLECFRRQVLKVLG